MLKEARALRLVSRDDQIIRTLRQAWDERVLNDGPRPTASNIATQLEIPERTISTDVKKLVEKGVLVRVGRGNNGTIMPVELHEKMMRAIDDAGIV
jgi:Fic family protein